MADPRGVLRGRWWNGKYGSMGRLDIWLYQDGPTWRVHGRRGGENGNEVHYEYAGALAEADARRMVERLKERAPGQQQWRDLLDAVRRANEHLR